MSHPSETSGWGGSFFLCLPSKFVELIGFCLKGWKPLTRIAPSATHLITHRFICEKLIRKKS
jgi:hypothetical protein